MEREITDSNGITWTCVQAYSGLDNNAENQDAAQVKGQEDSLLGRLYAQWWRKVGAAQASGRMGKIIL
jgi:hypothetical protein